MKIAERERERERERAKERERERAKHLLDRQLLLAGTKRSIEKFSIGKHKETRKINK